MSKRSSRGPSGGYEVGKGRPPKSTRWKPGQSGNPNGRPKGAKNAASKAVAALKRKVTVTTNGVKRRMTVEDIAYRRLADKALEGDQKAFSFLLMQANNLGSSDLGAADGAISTEQDHAIIADYFSRRRPQEDGSQ